MFIDLNNPLSATIEVGLLGAKTSNRDSLYALGDKHLDNVRFEEIERRILRIEAGLLRLGLDVNSIPEEDYLK